MSQLLTEILNEAFEDQFKPISDEEALRRLPYMIVSSFKDVLEEVTGDEQAAEMLDQIKTEVVQRHGLDTLENILKEEKFEKMFDQMMKEFGRDLIQVFFEYIEWRRREGKSE